MAELADSLVVSTDDRLDQAEAAVRGHCGWHIAPSRTETVTLQPTGSSVLMLPSLKVTAVSAVTEDGVAVSADDYQVDERGWLLRKWGRWTVGPLRVTFTHGYTDVPADVTGVVQSVAQRSIDGTAGLRSWSRSDGPFAEGGSLDSGAEFWANELSVLARYALPPRP